MSNKLLVIIAGSTGVGKTEVAIHLARHFKTEVLSADSRQVYREMNIGVGKPTSDQLTEVPHHFIGHISIHQPYTAAMFAKEARSTLEELFKIHDIVFLAGGTGLYIKALTEGLDEIPDVPATIFEKWKLLWEENGTDYLLSHLQERDPVYFKKVDQSNHTRLIRALSVCDSTGLPYSSFLRKEKTTLPFHVLPIALDMPRDVLYARIDKRVLQMLESGWVEEANALLPLKDLQALQTVGYKELFAHLAGESNYDNTISAIQQATRRYAKRQLTWLRNQGEWLAFHPSALSEMIDMIDQKRVSEDNS